MGDSPIDREGCLALGGLRCFEVGALHSTLLVADPSPTRGCSVRGRCFAYFLNGDSAAVHRGNRIGLYRRHGSIIVFQFKKFFYLPRQVT